MQNKNVRYRALLQSQTGGFPTKRNLRDRGLVMRFRIMSPTQAIPVLYYCPFQPECSDEHARGPIGVIFVFLGPPAYTAIHAVHTKSPEVPKFTSQRHCQSSDDAATRVNFPFQFGYLPPNIFIERAII